jgi:transcriptional regulator with XRE-family HTH domain
MTDVSKNLKLARAQKGWSQHKLAKAARVSQSTIDKIERGETLNSKFLPRIAAALERDVVELDPTITGRPANDPIPELRERRERPAMYVAKELPLFAAVEDSPGEIVIEKDQPIEMIARPDFLDEIASAYAVYLDGGSMEPEFRAGDKVLVHPRLPPLPHESYVFLTKDEDRAVIRHLVRVTPKVWHVEQWTPHRQSELDRAEWPKAHRIVGKYSRR